MASYNHKEIEKKWQERWDKENPYKTNINSDKKKTYLLVEFPYPSGAGLHVGHVRSYTAMDVVARKRRREGYEVLFPIGWDAFGLPAENYAIKTGIHPSITTRENISTFRSQLKACGFSFDFEREVDTTDPKYYKWTQWIFLKLYEKGLAYKKNMPVNWCPNDKCVLANEEVLDGKCERCGAEVEKKDKEQWMLAITKYAERLDKDLDETQFLDKIKIQQRNWIGISEGSEIDFKLTIGDSFTIFTTRADTLFGCTYCVFAPEHPLVSKLIAENKITNTLEVKKYVVEARQKLDIDRSAEGKEKTGVKLEGIMAINPVNKKEIPVFIADYVLPNYGTGAIMAVPAHDERDYEFAKKYNLEIIKVIDDGTEGDYNVGYGKLINSENFSGSSSEEAKTKITETLHGRVVKKSKLRDWVFARQRYWGEPIPIVYDETGKMYPVSATNLPITLPNVEKYEPTDNGESPLHQVADWVNVKGKIDNDGHFYSSDESDAKNFKRETDTMPQWAGSSWYFIRYIDNLNDSALGNESLLKKWLPVDWYNGGMEHTTLHLLYSRFWYKFLFDIGVVPTSEPYFRRTSQGMILGKGGVKMSKSLGNVINPDEIVEKDGADVLRLYEMFIGPFDQAVAWDDKAIIGVRRFLEKVDSLSNKVVEGDEVESITHKTIKQIGEQIESMSFNTCISQLMICANDYEKREKISKKEFTMFVQAMSPFAPFLGEELWEKLGMSGSVHISEWPKYDENKLTGDEVTIAFQVNGKLRGTFVIATNSSDEDIKTLAKSLDSYKKYIGDLVPKKEIVIKNKLINVVI